MIAITLFTLLRSFYCVKVPASCSRQIHNPFIEGHNLEGYDLEGHRWNLGHRQNLERLGPNVGGPRQSRKVRNDFHFSVSLFLKSLALQALAINGLSTLNILL